MDQNKSNCFDKINNCYKLFLKNEISKKKYTRCNQLTSLSRRASRIYRAEYTDWDCGMAYNQFINSIFPTISTFLGIYFFGRFLPLLFIIFCVCTFFLPSRFGLQRAVVEQSGEQLVGWDLFVWYEVLLEWELGRKVLGQVSRGYYIRQEITLD